MRKAILSIAILICIVGASFGAKQLLEFLQTTQDGGNRLIEISIYGAYILAIGLPFFPSFQIAVAFMLLFGVGHIHVTYTCCVLGFMWPFLIGRTVPVRIVTRVLTALNQPKLVAILTGTEATSDKMLTHLTRFLPDRFRDFAQTRKYLSLAILLNVPGNVFFGGSAGLLLMSGALRIFSTGGVVLLVLVCLCPIPVLLLVTLLI